MSRPRGLFFFEILAISSLKHCTESHYVHSVFSIRVRNYNKVFVRRLKVNEGDTFKVSQSQQGLFVLVVLLFD